MIKPNQLEQQVLQQSLLTGRSPAEIRRELMTQLNLTADAYAALNPTHIRAVLPGGGFMGQPG